MARISAVKRRNAWRRAIRQVGVLFVAFGLVDFAFTIFRGKFEFLQALFLAIFLNVAGILAINYSIDTEEEETDEPVDLQSQVSVEKVKETPQKEVLHIDLDVPASPPKVIAETQSQSD
jgi:hypothetical protein